MKEAIVFDGKKGPPVALNVWLAQATADEFNRRAVAGFFSQVPVVPKRREKISDSRVLAGESKQ